MRDRKWKPKAGFIRQDIDLGIKVWLATNSGNAHLTITGQLSPIIDRRDKYHPSKQRYEIVMHDGLTLPVVRMTKHLKRCDWALERVGKVANGVWERSHVVIYAQHLFGQKLRIIWGQLPYSALVTWHFSTTKVSFGNSTVQTYNLHWLRLRNSLLMDSSL